MERKNINFTNQINKIKLELKNREYEDEKEVLLLKFNQLKEKMRTKFYNKHINDKVEDFKLLKNKYKNPHDNYFIEAYNDFMNFLRKDNIYPDGITLNILTDHMFYIVIEFDPILTNAELIDAYYKQVINNKPITKQERLLTILQNRANKLLTTEQKRNILKAGRSVADISINVANKYTNLNDMLKAEKIMVNINHFTDEQINNIFIDPINLVYELVNFPVNITQLLKLYDPDAYYDGLTFFELIEQVKELLENEDKLNYIDTYTKFNEDILVNAINLLTLNKRSGYGIISILYQYNLLTVVNIVRIFKDLSNHINNKYVYKLFKSMLESDLNRFNLDTNSLMIGKGSMMEKFPFSVWNVKKNKRVVKQFNIEPFNIKLKKYYKIQVNINKMLVNIENNVYTEDMREFFDDDELKEYKEHEDDDINNHMIYYIEQYIDEIEDKIENILLEKQQYMYKKNGSNMLGLFFYIKDYDSVDAILDAGIDINTYSRMQIYLYRNYLYHPIQYIVELAIIKHYYRVRGLKLDDKLFDKILIHDSYTISYLFWAMFKLSYTKPKEYFENNSERIQYILTIIYNGIIGHELQTTGLVDDIINIILSY